MALRIHADPSFEISPADDLKGKNHIARRAGKKHVSGNIYKKRTFWNRFCDSMNASKGTNVMGKAATESRQYIEAAVLREASYAGPDCTDEEFDKQVWNSSSVQKRILRQDHVRFNSTHFSSKHGASMRNRIAYRLSRVAHLFHGLCEMAAAPTGMTTNMLKNLASGKVDDKSGKNRTYMFMFLPIIGIGTATGIAAAVRRANDFALFASQVFMTTFISFPLVSAAFGGLGTLAAVLAQVIVKKQDLTTTQKAAIQKGLNRNLQRLLHRLKSVKGNPELVKMLGKAMQGKAFLNKFSGDAADVNGTPVILNQVIDVVDSNKSDTDNMKAMQQVIGNYLKVGETRPVNQGRIDRIAYKRAVIEKEGHYTALMSLVDHVDLKNEHEGSLMDARKIAEEKAAPWIHDVALKILAYPVSLFDRFAGTKAASKLRLWASEEYRQDYSKRMLNPALAAKHRYSALYMFNNRHQYGRITRGLMILADGVRLINMGIVLSSNGQLSRIYNNLFYGIFKFSRFSPPSRSMCNSTGRFFGGLTLAAILGAIAGFTPQVDGAPAYVKNIPITDSRFPIVVSFVNIGILMALLAIPTILAQELAKITARVEGWKGNVSKTLPPANQRLVWSNT